MSQIFFHYSVNQPDKKLWLFYLEWLLGSVFAVFLLGGNFIFQESFGGKRQSIPITIFNETLQVSHYSFTVKFRIFHTYGS